MEDNVPHISRNNIFEIVMIIVTLDNMFYLSFSFETYLLMTECYLAHDEWWKYNSVIILKYILLYESGHFRINFLEKFVSYVDALASQWFALTYMRETGANYFECSVVGINRNLKCYR